MLFPLGALIGIVGVMMWPMFVWNFMKGYPGVAHPRVMVEGFLSCFIIGFLGTALPRLLDVPRMTLGEAFGFAGALLGIAWLHFTGHTGAGDQLFFLTLLMLVAGMVFRVIFRKDTPPPAFVLVALGILSAMSGSAIQIVAQIAPTVISGPVLTVGRLLLFQGYILLPIMGVGAFLLPRFFGMPGRQNFPESLSLPSGWMKGALFALICGITVIVSFVFEALGWLHLGYGLRAGAVILYFYREVPVHQAGFGGGTLALGLRIALVSIPCGYLLMAVWPERAFSFLHIVFITGFSLITLTVATRVVLGHSGQTHLFRASLRSVLFMASFVAVAMLTRVTADWMPALRMSHYAYAALVWIAGVITWAVVILPGVRLASPGE
ncbi:MAG: NnrS family protein [Verrucomicrobiota bacterium]